MTVTSADLLSISHSFTPSPGKLFHRLSTDLNSLFGGPVRKIPLDAGATCPNRDGTIGFGGCVFCDPGGSGPDDTIKGESWLARLERMAATQAAYGVSGVLAYFQAYSNTHGLSPGELSALIKGARAVKNVVGAVVATRPDCLGAEVLDSLEEAARETCFWVELGMQTSNDKTLRAMNRGHSHSATIEAVEALKKRGIPCVLHTVFGLPGEDADDVRSTMMEVARLAPWGIKIHPLLVLEGAALAVRWRRGDLHLLSRKEYVGMVVDGIEKLPPEITIHRLTGERPAGVMLAPDWCFDKHSVLGAIEREMADRGSFQGRGSGRRLRRDEGRGCRGAGG